MVNDTKRQEFDIRPNRVALVILFCLSLAGEALFIYFTITLDRPLELFGKQFTPQQGRIYFGAFACLGPIGLITLFWGVYLTFTRPLLISVTDKSIILPKQTRMGYSSEQVEIPFESIQSVQLRSIALFSKLIQIKYQKSVDVIPGYTPVLNMLVSKKLLNDLNESIQKALLRYRSSP